MTNTTHSYLRSAKGASVFSKEAIRYGIAVRKAFWGYVPVSRMLSKVAF